MEWQSLALDLVQYGAELHASISPSVSFPRRTCYFKGFSVLLYRSFFFFFFFLQIVYILGRLTVYLQSFFCLGFKWKRKGAFLPDSLINPQESPVLAKLVLRDSVLLVSGDFMQLGMEFTVA